MGMAGGRHTSSRNKLQVMRHRRVVNKSVCDHLVCFFIAYEKCKEISRGRAIQRLVNKFGIAKNGGV